MDYELLCGAAILIIACAVSSYGLSTPPLITFKESGKSNSLPETSTKPKGLATRLVGDYFEKRSKGHGKNQRKQWRTRRKQNRHRKANEDQFHVQNQQSTEQQVKGTYQRQARRRRKKHSHRCPEVQQSVDCKTQGIDVHQKGCQGAERIQNLTVLSLRAQSARSCHWQARKSWRQNVDWFSTEMARIDQECFAQLQEQTTPCSNRQLSRSKPAQEV